MAAQTPNIPATRGFKSLRAISALMLREMTTVYGASPGGYVWAILSPLFFIMILSVLFALILRTPSLGNNFPMFYATGYLPFLVYQEIERTVALSLKFSKSLLAYPTVTFADALIARFFLNLLTNTLVFLLVMTGLIIAYDLNPIIDAQAAMMSLMMAAALGFGFGVLNCFLISAFPVWQRIWLILSRPLFLLSAIIYLVDEVPPEFQDYLWYNPLVHVTALMRKAFFSTYEATFVSYAFPYTVAGVTAALGLLLLKRHHRRLLNQ
ncbi:MAG: ABC transporter permease [Pseudomonadota bacterium]